MLISMTGFGQGEVSAQGSSVSVEIRAVNHRFLDFFIKMPKGLSNRERDVKEAIKERIRRGRITVSVVIDSAQPSCKVSLNLTLMERYLEILRDFAKRHKLPGQVDINTLAVLPDVFEREESEEVSEEFWPMVEKGLEKALDACMRMRLEEGQALERDIRERIGAIDRVVGEIEGLAPEVLKQNKGAFRERLLKLVEGIPVDQDRWITEAAILADRLDFTEEIIRLKSHIGQFKQYLDEGGAVSKKLVYLLQEIHREATTIGSKACSAEVIEKIVVLKEESEKLREQLQNIE